MTRRLELLLRARRFDETLMGHADRITGVYHVCLGQEAAAAAIALCRQPGDTLMLNHRNHHHLIAIGSDPETLYREIFALDGGPQRGKAGTLHLADPERGVPYTSAMVGGGVPLALGLAWGRRRQGEPGVAFAVFGDGALGEGVVHECFNLASLWRLPVLFVCESNAERDGERANAGQAARTLTGLAEAHGIAGVELDGRDPQATADGVSALVDAIRAGEGPRFAHIQSAPWPGNRGFLPSADAGCGPLEEALGSGVGTWSECDPVLNEARALLSSGVDFARLIALDDEVRTEMRRAADAAASGSPAPREVALANVWGTR